MLRAGSWEPEQKQLLQNHLDPAPPSALLKVTLCVTDLHVPPWPFQGNLKGAQLFFPATEDQYDCSPLPHSMKICCRSLPAWMVLEGPSILLGAELGGAAAKGCWGRTTGQGAGEAEEMKHLCFLTDQQELNHGQTTGTRCAQGGPETTWKSLSHFQYHLPALFLIG